jgi:ornithine cyclodeaminase
VVFVFDQLSLRLKSVLCDEGLLTEVRTAAACVYASKFLLGARIREVQKVGIVGGGVQACWQLRLLAAAGVLPESCKTVVIKTRSKKSAEDFIQRMKSSTFSLDRMWNFEHYEPVASGGEAFQKCQLIHTMTPSRTPVLTVHDVLIPSSKGDGDKGYSTCFLHITAVGADCSGKCELDPALIERADVLVCDSMSQSKERGEFQKLERTLLEIGSMKNGLHDGSDNPCCFSVFDSSGLALQDVEMANLVSAFD